MSRPVLEAGMISDDLVIRVNDRIEVMEGEHFGKRGVVRGFTEGGLVIVEMADTSTIRVNPCHMGRLL